MKTYYKEGNNRYFCPDDGKTYIVDDGHISTLEDGIIGTYDDNGARIHGKSNTSQYDFFSTGNLPNHQVDEETAEGLYGLWVLAKSHIISLVVFFSIFGIVFVWLGDILENAYIGFFVGLIVAFIISYWIEKAIKSFLDLIRYGSIKGKFFLIGTILAVLILLLSIYSIWEQNDLIKDNKQHMAEDPSYSEYAIDRIEYAEKNIDELKIYCLSSIVVAIIFGGIFIVKNESVKKNS